MEGLEIEVYKSLLHVKILAGIPRNVFIYTTLIFAAVLILTENLLVIPVYIITCFIEMVISKKDPQFILIYIEKLNRNNYFGS